MAQDGTLTGVMRTGDIVALQGAPKRRWYVLLLYGAIRIVVSVKKEVLISFKDCWQGLQERPVSSRDRMEVGLGTIGSQSLRSAEVSPERELGSALSRREHHLFMIAFQRDEPAPTSQVEQLIDYAPRIWAAINAIPQNYQNVLGGNSEMPHQAG